MARGGLQRPKKKKIAYDMQLSGRGLMHVLFLFFDRGTEENQIGMLANLVTGSRFETGTSRKGNMSDNQLRSFRRVKAPIPLHHIWYSLTTQWCTERQKTKLKLLLKFYR